VAATIPVDASPDGIAVTPDGETAYVSTVDDSSATPIDVATNTVGTPIPVGGGPVGIAVTPEGDTAYVTIQSNDSVLPIDLAINTGPARPPTATDRALPQSATRRARHLEIDQRDSQTVNTPGGPRKRAPRTEPLLPQLQDAFSVHYTAQDEARQRIYLGPILILRGTHGEKTFWIFLRHDPADTGASSFPPSILAPAPIRIHTNDRFWTRGDSQCRAPPDRGTAAEIRGVRCGGDLLTARPRRQPGLGPAGTSPRREEITTRSPVWTRRCQR
jgi:YVTN family beta-propeller protein